MIRKFKVENPGLVLVNHGKTGASEIIPGKVYYDDHNYSKLIYNTHFPWEDHDQQGGTSMEYSFRSLDPRDVRGDDYNFYLTGATIANTKDRSRMAFEHELTVGHFGLPHIDGKPAEVRQFDMDGKKVISALQHKNDDTEWTYEELSPVMEIKILDVTPVLTPLGAEITLHDGSIRKVNYPQIDGNRRC